MLAHVPPPRPNIWLLAGRVPLSRLAGPCAFSPPEHLAPGWMGGLRWRGAGPLALPKPAHLAPRRVRGSRWRGAGLLALSKPAHPSPLRVRRHLQSFDLSLTFLVSLVLWLFLPAHLGISLFHTRACTHTHTCTHLRARTSLPLPPCCRYHKICSNGSLVGVSLSNHMASAGDCCVPKTGTGVSFFMVNCGEMSPALQPQGSAFL